MEKSLFLRTVFCCSDREYKNNPLNLGGHGESFVIANGQEFWIVKAENQFDAIQKLVSKTWKNSLFDFRIYECGWGSYEYIVAKLIVPSTNYLEHSGSDSEYLKLLGTVEGSERVYITREYLEPEDYERHPAMPI